MEFGIASYDNKCYATLRHGAEITTFDMTGFRYLAGSTESEIALVNWQSDANKVLQMLDYQDMILLYDNILEKKHELHRYHVTGDWPGYQKLDNACIGFQAWAKKNNVIYKLLKAICKEKVANSPIQDEYGFLLPCDFPYLKALICLAKVLAPLMSQIKVWESSMEEMSGPIYGLPMYFILEYSTPVLFRGLYYTLKDHRDMLNRRELPPKMAWTTSALNWIMTDVVSFGLAKMIPMDFTLSDQTLSVHINKAIHSSIVEYSQMFPKKED